MVGDRGTKTGLNLWEKIGKFAQGTVMTDHWMSYKQIVPSDQLIQSKAETYTVESYNSLIRHFLARFRRNKVLLKVGGDDDFEFKTALRSQK